MGRPGEGVREIATLFNVTRMYNAIASASLLRRAVVLARDYAGRREAFGRRLRDHPLHARTLARLESDAAAAQALAFRVAALQGREECGTATASESWARLVYRVGRDKQVADDNQATREEITRQLRNLQDSVSGVSLDEEAADLVRFQRAYEANARFFGTINATLDTLLNMV